MKFIQFYTSNELRR